MQDWTNLSVNDKRELLLIYQAKQERASFWNGLPQSGDYFRKKLKWSPWYRQQQVLTSVLLNRRTAVKSGNGVGKTKVAAGIALAFLDLYRPSIVITTAPTWTQVHKILWAELKSDYRKAGRFFGVDPIQTGLQISDKHYAIGFSTDREVRFQGYHEKNILFIFDEAAGIPDMMWDAVEGSMVGSNARWLAIGNPTAPSGKFFECFGNPQWAKLTISCLEHPNVVEGKNIIEGAVTREWVEERKNEWGESSPIFMARVLGQFSESGDDRLIPMQWIENAFTRYRSNGKHFEGKKVLGADIARSGADSTVYAIFTGDILTKLVIRKKPGEIQRTTDTAGEIKATKDEEKIDTVGVDVIGIGAGVVDSLEALGVRVVEINSAEKMKERRGESMVFNNLRSQMWWQMRRDLEHGLISLLPDEKMKEELWAPRYGYNHKGEIEVESKDEIKKRLHRSPDRADAVVYANWLRIGAGRGKLHFVGKEY